MKVATTPDQFGDANSQNRITVITIYLLMTLLYLLIFTPLYFFFYHIYILGWMLAFDILVCLYFLFQVQRTRNVELTADALCGIAAVTIGMLAIHGGLSNSGPFYIFAASVFFFLLTNAKRGLAWSAALNIALLIALCLSLRGMVILPYPSDQFLFLIITNVFVVSLLYGYSRQKEKLDSKLRSSLQEIKGLASKLDEEKQGVERKVITRTKELQAALHTTQLERDKISAIIQSIGDGVLVLDEKRVIISVNKITEQITGYSKEALLGTKYTTLLKFVTEKGRTANSFIEHVYKTGEMTSMDPHTMLIRKDGSRIPVSDSAAPLVDFKGKLSGCVVVFQDVTREREVEQMKDDFLSMAAHQLRTPLTALRWQSQRLMKRKTGPLNEGQLALTNDIHLSAVRLIDLVGQLLDVSHIETGNLLVHPSEVDVRKIIEEQIELIKVRFIEKNQEIIFAKPEKLPLIWADERLITQVYQNLISNACKYTAPKGTVMVSLHQQGGMLISEVEDTGIGIPETDREHLFGRFKRGSSEAVGQEEGTGLGLYLAKKIVEASGGEIGFKNAEKIGTVFWFSLPLTKAHGHHPPA